MAHAIPLLLVMTAFAATGIASLTTLAQEPIRTNEVTCANPPSWLTESKIDKVVSHAEDVLQWDIRRIQLIWHSSEAEFEAVHKLGPGVLAVTFKAENTVHMGPEITRGNFEGVFGHELTHVVLFQKFGKAIPAWLEEGLANWVGKRGRVDYAWLASQPRIEVTNLTHPFGKSATPASTQLHYMASTAVVEMIAARCDLEDLLQLSVGSQLTTYLDTSCGISDVNADFAAWVRKKSRSPGLRTARF